MTIRKIDPCENYSEYIEALNILDFMVRGYRLPVIRPNKDLIAVLKQIIKFEVDSVDNGIPKYVQALVHHFLIKRTQIIINLGDWRRHYIERWLGEANYGYKKVGHLFGYDDQDGTVDFELFIKLFPNTKVFSVINIESATKANPSIDLSYGFILKILKCIVCLNCSSKAVSCSRFKIIKPLSSMNEFVQNNKQKIENKGWKLKTAKFDGKGVWSNFNQESMLLIEKMIN